MASKMVELRHAVPHPPTPRISFLAAILLLASLAGMAGCGVTTGYGASPGSGGSGAPTSTASSQQSDGNWQTVMETSGSSTSSGGGTNQDTSTQSTTVGGAYRVMAACQGSGSLQITLKPGGALTVHCTSARQDPARIAGSDSAPADGILEIMVDRRGDVESSDVLVQVRD